MTATLTAFKFTILAPARLLTENALRRMHWGTRAPIIKSWRAAAKVLAKHEKVPRFAWVELDIGITQARGVLADGGNHYPVVKAIVDGLVDAGIIPDDDPEHVRRIIQHPPVRAKADAVSVVIRGELRQRHVRPPEPHRQEQNNG